MKAFFMVIAAVGLSGAWPALATDTAEAPIVADQAKLFPTARAAVPIPGVVTRAQLTHGIKNLEPVDSVSAIPNDQPHIIYFTEIHDMAGQKVKHRWEYHGQIILEVPISVGTSRWRAYSSKTLLSSWTGDWKVSLVDAAG
ncbi:MAG: DUF2914 domain-containing protein, partial [Sulfuricaulis sp.]|nr:DUF2914 domain-containing protein [Sulfuricaulis sp.]